MTCECFPIDQGSLIQRSITVDIMRGWDLHIWNHGVMESRDGSIKPGDILLNVLKSLFSALSFHVIRHKSGLFERFSDQTKWLITTEICVVFGLLLNHRFCKLVKIKESFLAFGMTQHLFCCLSSSFNSCEAVLPSDFVTSFESHPSPGINGFFGVALASFYSVAGPGEPPNVPLYPRNVSWTHLWCLWGCSTAGHFNDPCVFETKPVRTKHGKCMQLQ